MCASGKKVDSLRGSDGSCPGSRFFFLFYFISEQSDEYYGKTVLQDRRPANDVFYEYDK